MTGAARGADLPGGERVGPYRLLELLGTGAMGTVWLAEDEEEGNRVALKVLHPNLAERPGFFRRFQREAAAGSRVVDPHVVRTIRADMIESAGAMRCLLVMEHADGRTLRDVLDDLGTVPEALVREVAAQCAEGLAAIHAAGLVHRDLKPENVILSDDHRVRIMDLGVAKDLDAATALTQEGQFAGSLPYAAPEQFRGRDVTAATDLYALGVVLHELLTGVNPFERETAAGVLQAHLFEDPPDVFERAPDATPFAAEVVRTLLAKDPAHRFGGAALLARTIREGERSAWWHEHEDGALRRRSNVPRVPVRRDTTLHGREGDLAMLRLAWDQARAGNGNTVLVMGEAGIGKSRLVDALFDAVKSDGARVLYGSTPPVGGFGAIADAVVAHLGADDLAAKLATYLGDAPRLAAPLAALLRHEPAPDGSLSLQGDALHAALVRLMRGLARETPLLWVVEDLHFADADQRKVALSLARAVEGHRILLVLTSRPALGDAELAAFDRLDSLRRTSLDRLGAREVMLLLRDALRNERLAEKLCGKVALASDGNPFFVFETIRALRQGQLITQLPDGTWIDTRVIDQIPVPTAVRDLIEARLRDLPMEQRNLLDAGAVIGFEFEPDVLADALGEPRLRVLQQLSQIERVSGVVRSAGRRFRFDHHQIQEIVAADLSLPLREAYHAAIGDAIERRARADGAEASAVGGDTAVAIAEHLLHGACGDRALPYLDAALAWLDRQFANERFVALADAALAVPGLLEGARRISTVLRLSVPQGPLQRLARHDALRARAEEALALAQASGNRTSERAALVHLGSHGLRASNVATAIEMYERALALAREDRDELAESSVLVGLSAALYRSGRADDALAMLDRARALDRPDRPQSAEITIAGNRGNVLQGKGRLDEAAAEFERSRDAARSRGDVGGEGRALGGLCSVLNARKRYGKMLPLAEARFALARATGDRSEEAGALTDLGLAHWGLRQSEEARRNHERSAGISRETGDLRSEGFACGNLGCVAWTDGRFEEALLLYRRQLAIAQETRTSYMEFVASTNLGSVAHSLGRGADARAHHEHCLAMARRDRNRLLEATALASLGSLRFELGDAAGARRELEECVALSRGSGAPEVAFGALLWMACIAAAAGDAGGADRFLDEAEDVARASEDPEFLPAVLLARGRLLADRGTTDGARDALTAAAKLARERSCTTNEVLAVSLLATLPGGHADEALSLIREHESRMEWADAMEAWFRIGSATGDAAHLAEARRRLDHLVAHAPPECREAMVANVPLHRRIAGAAPGAGPPEPPGDRTSPDAPVST